MSMVTRSTTTHDCREHYKLLENSNELFSCYGCKMNGLGPRYICNRCGIKQLHKECRHPNKTVTHEYFPGSDFVFFINPCTKLDPENNTKYFSRCCSACRKDICGFSYRCKEDDKDLHPYCRNLPKKLLIDNNIVFNLKAKLSSKCSWCRKKKISNDKSGWAYASACKKQQYHFHVSCLTDILHDAYIKYVDMASGKANIGRLVNSSTGGIGRELSQTLKYFIKIILTVFLGDPTLLISNVMVELFARLLQ